MKLCKICNAANSNAFEEGDCYVCGGRLLETEGMIEEASALLGKEAIYACQVRAERFDTGRPFGLLRASIEMGLRDPEVGPQLREYLRERVAGL